MTIRDKIDEIENLVSETIIKVENIQREFGSETILFNRLEEVCYALSLMENEL